MKRRSAFQLSWVALLIASGLACNKESSPPPEKSPEKQTAPPVRHGGREGTISATTQEANTSTTQPASPSTQAWAPTEKSKPRVEMRIRQGNEDWGWIVVELNEAAAPITVANFLRYVDEGFYNGTIFHRVMPSFMVQGGSHVPPRVDKTEGVHGPIKLEAQNGLKNLKGTIAMARTGDPNSATTGFFINVVDNAGLDYPQPDGNGYAVFGKVVDGEAVVDKIRNVPTVANPDNPREKSSPVDPPMIVVVQRAK